MGDLSQGGDWRERANRDLREGRASELTDEFLESLPEGRIMQLGGPAGLAEMRKWAILHPDDVTELRSHDGRVLGYRVARSLLKEEQRLTRCGACGQAATWIASDRDERNEPVDCCAFCGERL